LAAMVMSVLVPIYCFFCAQAGARPLQMPRRSPPPTDAIKCRAAARPGDFITAESFLECHRTHPPRRLHWWAALALDGIAGDQSLVLLLGETLRRPARSGSPGRGAGEASGREEIHHWPQPACMKAFLTSSVLAAGVAVPLLMRPAGGAFSPGGIEKMASPHRQALLGDP